MLQNIRTKFNEKLKNSGVLGEILTTPVTKRGLISLGLAGLTAFSALPVQAKSGFYLEPGVEIQFFEEGPLEEVYGQGFGIYGKAGGYCSTSNGGVALDGGIKLGYLFGYGDTREIESLFHGESTKKTMGIPYFGPQAKISFGSDLFKVFFDLGYEFYILGDQTEYIANRWFEREHITRTDREFLKGSTIGGGFSIPLRFERKDNKPIDTLLNIGIDYRTAEIIKGPSLQGSFQVNF